MDFQTGDTVMHCVHGLGKVIKREERTEIHGPPIYYVVEVRDMTIWVPADDTLENRLRLPTLTPKFAGLLETLSQAGEPLPDDRHQRRLLLVEWLKGGDVESLFRTIRGLSTYRRIRPLSDNDQNVFDRLEAALLAEWALVMTISLVTAAQEFHRLLALAPDGSQTRPVSVARGKRR